MLPSVNMSSMHMPSLDSILPNKVSPADFKLGLLRRSSLQDTENETSCRSDTYVNSVSNLSELLCATQRESQLFNENDDSNRELTTMPGFGYQDKPLAELFTNTTLLFAGAFMD